jgi:hypothetical protein
MTDVTYVRTARIFGVIGGTSSVITIGSGRTAGGYEALARDRAALWHDRAQLRADRGDRHDHEYRDRYNRW